MASGPLLVMTTWRRRKVYSGANAVNEEDPSATALRGCRRLVPPCYVPEGDSPLSLLATELFE